MAGESPKRPMLQTTWMAALPKEKARNCQDYPWFLTLTIFKQYRAEIRATVQLC
jgi:hypothetical protein